MSLSDRLAEARRARGGRRDEHRAASDAMASHGRKHRRAVDPFAELKQTVHQSLLENLARSSTTRASPQSELEQKVRLTLQEVLAQEETPLTVQDRARIAQEIADDILGYGPLEPYLRDPDITEVMVNGADSIYIERSGKIVQVDGHFNDEAHLRRTIDKIVGAGRPPRRRVQPDGRRPPARRQPRQRRHPAAGARRLAAHHPQVLRRPLPGPRTSSASAP